MINSFKIKSSIRTYIDWFIVLAACYIKTRYCFDILLLMIRQQIVNRLP